jgi:hypothetical protein
MFCYRQVVGINLGTPSHVHVSEHGIILLYRTGQLDPIIIFTAHFYREMFTFFKLHCRFLIKDNGVGRCGIAIVQCTVQYMVVKFILGGFVYDTIQAVANI